MQDVKASRATTNPLSKGILLLALFVIALVSVSVYTVKFNQALRVNVLPPDTVTISQAVLEEKYGVRVNLLAVTAAGGFVDLRLQILDGDKARVLLESPQNFPSLVIGNNVKLNVSQEAREQGIDFENSHNLFIMFPNGGNSIKRGTPVTILFGDTALEPVDAK